MDENSTRTKQITRQEGKNLPKQSTIAFIRQFARIYMPVAGMPGLVMN